MNRRNFIKSSVAAGMAVTMTNNIDLYGRNNKKVRLGFIGVGGRGTGLLKTVLSMENVDIPAICDINVDNLSRAKDLVEKAGMKTPDGYSKGEEDFRRMLLRDDLDAVIIATPWEWHTPMAVCGMKSGKYVGVEVPAAITIEQCWNLINAYEKTGVPCMMLENWSFRRDNLAVLNMIRQGLLGEIVHCHCAHSHDCIDHWFFDKNGEMRWGGEYLLKRNCDQYPTHSLGPVISWMDIGCGDYFEYISSTATRSTGINAYFKRKFGPGHPNSKRKYKQGDIVTSTVKTVKGNTLIINYDMQLPRPYDNRWMIQGTLGIYNEQRNAIYLTGKSPEYHEWESFEPYQEKYEHRWWQALKDESGKFGHGGTDYLELQKFIKAVRNKTQTPIDVYESVIMSSVIPLSEESISQNGIPVQYPDFTRGKWKTKKSTFAVTGE